MIDRSTYSKDHVDGLAKRYRADLQIVKIKTAKGSLILLEPASAISRHLHRLTVFSS